MKKSILVSLMLLSSAVFAQSPMSKESYEATKQNADATFKTQAESCLGLQNNAKDVCVAKAKAERIKIIATAEAHYKNTPDAMADANKKIADADYDVAKELCDDLQGNKKDVCLKQAKANHVSAKADAKVAKKGPDAVKDANKDKMDAQYKVEKEKCDALSGTQKDECEKNVKQHFNK